MIFISSDDTLAPFSVLCLDCRQKLLASLSVVLLGCKWSLWQEKEREEHKLCGFREASVCPSGLSRCPSCSAVTRVILWLVYGSLKQGALRMLLSSSCIIKLHHWHHFTLPKTEVHTLLISDKDRQIDKGRLYGILLMIWPFEGKT